MRVLSCMRHVFFGRDWVMLFMRNYYHCLGLVGFAVISGLMMVFLVSGCATTEQLAPPVQVSVLESADRLGYGDEQVERGRVIYLSKCIKCHGVRSVQKYSAERWEGILAKMSVKAKLSESEEEDVGAYIYSVLEIEGGMEESED